MTSRKPFILFITGINASGKTTLCNKLKEEKFTDVVAVHDVDEVAVPPVGRTPWRAFRIDELFYRAVENYKQNASTIICGVSYPHEVVESRYFNPDHNIHFLLLDVSFEIFKRRQDERIESAKKAGKTDESFDKDIYQELMVYNRGLIRKLQNSTQSQRNGHIIDASKSDPDQMLQQTMAIIRAIS